jgi:hypothetical protein
VCGEEAVILPRSVIQELTGYTRGSAQARWLKDHGWRFTVNGLGDVIVAAAEYNRHMVGGKAARQQEPDLTGING